MSREGKPTVPENIAPMECYVCGRKDARVRDGQRGVALMTQRGHVDCVGHSQYRALTWCEVTLLQGEALVRGAMREADFDGDTNGD